MAKENGTSDLNSHAPGEGVVTDAELMSALGLDSLESDVDDVNEVDADATSEEDLDEATDGDNGGDEGVEEADEDDAGNETSEEDEEKTDPESEEDEEKKEDDEDKEEKLPRSTRKLQKRVNTLTKSLRETEEERDRIKEQLTKAQAPVLAPSQEDPYSDLTTREAVEQRIAQYKEVRRWCRANPDGGEVKNQAGETITLSAADVRQREAYVSDMLEAAPARLEYLNLHEQAAANARTVYPELFQEGTNAQKIMASFIKQNPGILNLPNYHLIIGDAIRGTAARLAEKTEKTTTRKEEKETPKAASKKPAPRALKPNSAPPPAGKARVNSKAANRFEETGSVADLAHMLEATL